MTSESYHVRLQDWEVRLLDKYHMPVRRAIDMGIQYLAVLDPVKLDAAMKEAAEHAAKMKRIRKEKQYNID